MGWQIEYYIIG